MDFQEIHFKANCLTLHHLFNLTTSKKKTQVNGELIRPCDDSIDASDLLTIFCLN